MGIFGNKLDSNQAVSDQAQADQGDSQQAVDSFAGSPVIQDSAAVSPAADSDAGDYIMTDNPQSGSPVLPQDSATATAPEMPTADSTPVDQAPEPAVAENASSEPFSGGGDPIAVRTTVSGSASMDELADIKKGALQQLAPLVPHLDQTAEERFRTIMMMLQATDDTSLIKQAYEAAQDIQEETVRAQALLDIVNEINYLTNNKKSS